MARGPGKYDSLCLKARQGACAQGAVLIIIEGSKGTGFSAQFLDPQLGLGLPAILREVADEIEKEFE
jgi:hypothetical protein